MTADPIELRPLDAIPLDAIPLDDRGLLLGDGLFETLLFTRGAPVLAEAHAGRMRDGAAVLGLPAPATAEFIDRAVAAVGAAGLSAERAAVRITLTAGSGGRGLDRPATLRPRLFATAAPATKPDMPARLVIATARRNPASPSSRLKTLGYLDNVLARREASAAGADEAVMLNTRGELACAAAANLFWLSGDLVMTPALETGRLDGLMARQVIAAATTLGVEVRQVSAGVEALGAADAIFLTSSLVGVRPAGLADRAAPAPHPLVARLAAAIAGFV